MTVLAVLCAAAAAENPARAQFELPAVERRGVLEGREVYSHARLEGLRYGFQNAMVVRASLERTRRILTHFGLFAGLVPYIQRSEYDAKTGLLDVAGGIWKYRLESVLQFREESPERWSFRVVRGHFLGMTGVMEFRRLEAGRTLVSLEGGVTGGEGASFPPRLIIEQGAQIVFAVTGRRVRSLVEDLAFEPQDAGTPAEKASRSGSRNESERSAVDDPSRSGIPRPRSGLR